MEWGTKLSINGYIVEIFSSIRVKNVLYHLEPGKNFINTRLKTTLIEPRYH
jgi:hypothetical protein